MSLKRSSKNLLRQLEPLPVNWSHRTDEEGRPFYWNHVTMVRSYEKPVGLPNGWREARDPKTDELYYYNWWTRETKPYAGPRPIPPPAIAPHDDDDALPGLPGAAPTYSRSKSALVPAKGSRRSTLNASMHARPSHLLAAPPLETERAADLAGVPMVVDTFSTTSRFHAAQGLRDPQDLLFGGGGSARRSSDRRSTNPPGPPPMIMEKLREESQSPRGDSPARARASTSGAVLNSSPYVARPQPPGPPPGKPPLPAGPSVLKRAPSQETMLATSAEWHKSVAISTARRHVTIPRAAGARGGLVFEALADGHLVVKEVGSGLVEGLRKGDVVVAVDGHELARATSLDSAAATALLLDSGREPSLTLDGDAAEAPEAAVTVDGEMSERSTVELEVCAPVASVPAAPHATLQQRQSLTSLGFFDGDAEDEDGDGSREASVVLDG